YLRLECFYPAYSADWPSPKSSSLIWLSPDSREPEGRVKSLLRPLGDDDDCRHSDDHGCISDCRAPSRCVEM
ncbi:unnamed protein product, partial [Closterium sp. Naga37s-1]